MKGKQWNKGYWARSHTLFVIILPAACVYTHTRLTCCEMPSPMRGTFSVAIRAGLGVLKCALLTVHAHYMHTERKKERKEEKQGQQK